MMASHGRSRIAGWGPDLHRCCILPAVTCQPSAFKKMWQWLHCTNQKLSSFSSACLLNKDSLLQAFSFEVEEDTSGFSEYEKGGIVTQFKEKKVLDFRTLAQALEDPGEFLLSDFAKLERPALLHVGFQALAAFQVTIQPLSCAKPSHQFARELPQQACVHDLASGKAMIVV